MKFHLSLFSIYSTNLSGFISLNNFLTVSIVIQKLMGMKYACLGECKNKYYIKKYFVCRKEILTYDKTCHIGLKQYRST